MFGGGAELSLHGFAVDFDQAETGPEAFIPFKIIKS